MNRGAELLRRYFQSQQEVAPRLGIEPSMLSLLLAGKRKPSIETAAAIERLFGVPMIAWTEERHVHDWDAAAGRGSGAATGGGPVPKNDTDPASDPDPAPRLP